VPPVRRSLRHVSVTWSWVAACQPVDAPAPRSGLTQGAASESRLKASLASSVRGCGTSGAAAVPGRSASPKPMAFSGVVMHSRRGGRRGTAGTVVSEVDEAIRQLAGRRRGERCDGSYPAGGDTYRKIFLICVELARPDVRFLGYDRDVRASPTRSRDVGRTCAGRTDVRGVRVGRTIAVVRGRHPVRTVRNVRAHLGGPGRRSGHPGSGHPGSPGRPYPCRGYGSLSGGQPCRAWRPMRRMDASYSRGADGFLFLLAGVPHQQVFWTGRKSGRETLFLAGRLASFWIRSLTRPSRE
jgi:hypothetical protein